MPTAAGWTDLDSIRKWLRIGYDATGTYSFALQTGDDALLTQLGADLTAEFVSELGRDILTASYSEIHSGNGKSVISLDQYPISAVSSLVVDGMTISAVTGPFGFGYQFERQKLYFIGGVFPEGVRNILVSYTAGYAAVPADIVRALLEQIGYVYRSRSRIGVKSQTVQGQTDAFHTEELLPSVLGILDKHRRWVVAG